MNVCPTTEALERFLSGEMSEDEQDELGSHLKGCTECSEQLERLSHDERLEELLCLEQPSSSAESDRSIESGLAEATPPYPATEDLSHSDPQSTMSLGVSSSDSVPVSSGQATQAPSAKRFADYELLEEIARGGMGVVHKARQISLDRTVALKMILSGEFADEEEEQQFRNEAEAAARLDHSGIVPVFEIGQHEGRLYFSMAFVEGTSLAALVAERPLAPTRAAEVTRKIADAVAYAHQKGVIHRDLKPANVLIDQDGEPRVTDFGLAKRLDADSTATATGKVMGTPAYMPPEQASGETDKVGPLSDVYSLGATLYCLLTGRPPFQAANPIDTLLQVTGEEPVAPRQLNSNIPRDLETICLKCLEKDLHRRYESAESLAEDLGRFLRNEPVKARPIGTLGRAWRWCRRRPLVASLSAGVLSLLVALVIVFGASSAVRANLLKNVTDAKNETDKALVRERVAKEQTAEALEDEQTQRYISEIRLAHEKWKSGQISNAKELLQNHVPANGEQDRRGFEWFYLWNLVHGFEPYKSVDGSVNSLDCSPDGKRFVIAASTGVNTVWNLQTGEAVSSIRATQTFGGIGIGFVPVAGAIIVQSVVAGGAAEKAGLKVNDGIAGVVLPDGSVFEAKPERLAEIRKLIVGKPGTDVVLVIVRNEDEEQQRVALTRQPITFDTPATRVRFAPDGQHLVSSHQDNQLRSWDAATGELLWSVSLSSKPFDFDISPDGDLLAVVEQGRVNRVTIWNAQSQKVVGDLNLPLDLTGGTVPPPTAVAWAPNGSGLAVAAGIFVFLYADVQQTRDPVGSLQLTSGVPLRISYSPDGRTLATATLDRVIIWDLESRTKRAELIGNEIRIADIAFSPDGASLAVGGFRRSVDVWDVRSASIRRRWRGHRGSVTSLAFTSDGRLVSGDGQGAVAVWDGQADQDSQALGLDVLAVGDLAFAPDNDDLVIAAGRPQFHQDGQLLSVEVNAKVDPSKHVHWFRELPFEINCLAFAPEDRYLAVGGGSYRGAFGTVQLWDWPKRQMVWTNRQIGFVSDLAFSSDGKWLAIASFHPAARRGEVVLLDLGSREVHSLTSRMATSVAFSPDNELLAVGGERNVTIYCVARRDIRAEIPGHGSLTHSAAFFPDGKTLAFAQASLVDSSKPAKVVLWDLESQAVARQWTAHDSSILSMDLSPDGSRLATGGRDGGLRLWNSENGRLVREMGSKKSLFGSVIQAISKRAIVSVRFSRDGNHLLTTEGAFDAAMPTVETLRIWHVATGQEVASVSEPKVSTAVAFTSDGTRVVAAGAATGVLHSFRADRLEQESAHLKAPLTLNQPRGLPACSAISPDGKRLVAGMADHRVGVWNLDSYELSQTLDEFHTSAVTCVAFSSNGLVVTGSGTNVLRYKRHTPGEFVLWELGSGKEQRQIRIEQDACVSAAFSPDGRKLVTLSSPASPAFRQEGSRISLWDVASGSEEMRYRARAANGAKIPLHVSDLAISPDGRYLVAAGAAIYVWSAETGEQLAPVSGDVHVGWIYSVLFSPDGRTLFTCSNDRKVKLWHMGTWQELLVLDGHNHWVTELAVSPDGRRLASGGMNPQLGLGEIRLWPAAAPAGVEHFLAGREYGDGEE